MMEIPEDFEDFSGEIESEYARRVDELAKIENAFSLSVRSDDEDLEGLLRNTMIVMLYAYFEGFCKKIFEIYILYINRTNESVARIQAPLAAATLEKDFKRLEDPHHAPDKYGINYEEDGKLKRYARRVEFTEVYQELMNKNIDIPDSIANTESNLKPDVLKRIMFNLALDHRSVDEDRGSLYKLLGYRNDIAHGTFTRPITVSKYEECKIATFHLMGIVKDVVVDSYRECKYLKN